MIDDATVIDCITAALSNVTDKQHSVSLARINTYVYQTDVSKTVGNKRIVFPTLASHWAVIVSHSKYADVDAFGYHLTFEEAAAALSSPPQTHREEWYFHLRCWNRYRREKSRREQHGTVIRN